MAKWPKIVYAVAYKTLYPLTDKVEQAVAGGFPSVEAFLEEDAAYRSEHAVAVAQCCAHATVIAWFAVVQHPEKAPRDLYAAIPKLREHYTSADSMMSCLRSFVSAEGLLPERDKQLSLIGNVGLRLQRAAADYAKFLARSKKVEELDVSEPRDKPAVEPPAPAETSSTAVLDEVTSAAGTEPSQNSTVVALGTTAGFAAELHASVSGFEEALKALEAAQKRIDELRLEAAAVLTAAGFTIRTGNDPGEILVYRRVNKFTEQRVLLQGGGWAKDLLEFLEAVWY